MAENTTFHALFRIGIDYRITRIYSEGWDSNIAAWQEEVEEHFDAICRYYGDDPKSCKLVGEAKWVWMRFSAKMVAKISEQEFKGASQVTMIRVHRVRGKIKSTETEASCG